MKPPPPPYWGPYVAAAHDHSAFGSAARVIDIGCGDGEQLRKLARRGCRAVGVEITHSLASRARARDAPTVVAHGESLPFPDAAFDAAVSKGVLMYTQEELAIREISRLVRVGGEVDLMVNGAGYYLRYALCSMNLKHRFYGLRTLLNTWLLRVAGRRLPGFLGDTVYDSKGRVLRLCQRHRLEITTHTESPRFLGLPVFIYLRLQRV